MNCKRFIFPDPTGRGFGAAALTGLLGILVASGLRAEGPGAGGQAAAVVAKPGAPISLSLADPNAPAGQAYYSLRGVTRNGQEIPTPPNMTLDSKSGEFAWAPRASQAGEYRLEFMIAEPPPRRLSTAVRRIAVQAGPIATDRGQVGQLLRTWYAAGTAAGNTGDFYDNRDRGHSRLKTSLFPQLDVVVYPEQLKQRRLDWGLPRFHHSDRVTLGNSSTASGPTAGGSNPRMAMMSAAMAGLLYKQYTSGQLYVYPEHRDHDPGRNGRGGYGDLYPANMPYLITSQGSSGSDRPFLEAVAATLAAFRPEVKQRLIRTGLLMPTVQMIFRMSNRNVKYLKDYLTGRAHPTAFVGGNVDALKMVRMAHDIRLETIPPMVRLTVVEEDEAVEGRDYFDQGKSEKLFDTPAAIARVVRSVKHTRRMVVSAEGSRDLNGLPLKHHWVVLRGDPAKIRITPLNEDASKVELLVDYHRRRPIQPGAEMESARVDIGAFVHNGSYYSAPGFVCFFSLADEARTYDDKGRIREVSYGCGDSTIGYPTENLLDKGYDVADWQGLLQLTTGNGKGLAAALLRKRLLPKELADLKKAAGEFRVALAAFRKLEGASATGRPLEEARKAAQRVLTTPRAMLGESIRRRLESALNAVKDDAALYPANAQVIQGLCEACDDARTKKDVLAARDGLVKAGILTAAGGGSFRPSPALTRHQRNRLEWFNIALMKGLLYPGMLNVAFRRNYVDARLSTPKDWRDVYHYDDRGELIGWTRFDGGQEKLFTANGALVVKTDALGRTIEARPVQYIIDRDPQGKPHRLKYVPLPTIRRYEPVGPTPPKPQGPEKR